MANPSPPDPPPSISAAELRRRLLASTPPPLGGPATGTVEMDPPTDPARFAAEVATTEDLLRRLRVPGHSQSGLALPAGGAAPDPSANLRAAPATPRFGSAEPPAVYGAGAYASVPGAAVTGESPVAELQRLRGENKELRQLLNEMKHLLQEASDAEQVFAQVRQQYATELADKNRQIEELTAQLQQIEDQISSGSLAPVQPNAPPKTKTELEEWADELEQESAKVNQIRKQLDDDRRQLREDEESLEKQMRQMEVSMARERALMARQETELKRLSAEIQHELELMQRGDAALREQMSKFQRRAQEVMTKPPGGTGPGGGSGVRPWPGR